MDLYVTVSEEDYPTTHLRFCIAKTVPTGDMFHVWYVTNEGQHLFDYKEIFSPLSRIANHALDVHHGITKYQDTQNYYNGFR